MKSRHLQFDHASVSVNDLTAAVQFYGRTLGLEQIKRPDFAFPGAWFRAGHTSIHLTTGGSVDRINKPLPGEPHLALALPTEHDLDELVEELRTDGFPVYELEHSPAALRQVFVLDPSGNEIELCVNFQGSLDDNLANTGAGS